MTTAAKAVGEYWRLKNLIKRQPAGWQSPVNVQDWAPNAPGYSWSVAGRVDHCGLSMNTLLHNIGLRVNVDFPNCAWTPTAKAWTDTRDPDDFSGTLAGDLLLFRDAGSAYSATHIGIALEDWDGGGVLSGEFNTTPDGMGREYRRTPGYWVAVGRPAYHGVVPPPPIPEPPAVVVTGAIGARWRAIGAEKSVLGAPKGNERQFLGDTRVQHFAGGSILWSNATGAWEVYGEIGRRWWSDAAGLLGLPTSGEWDGDGDGWRWQSFARGRMLFTPTGGACVIRGAILMHYLNEAPDVRARLGAPMSDEIAAKASLFSGGAIGWTEQAGAFTST